MTDPTSALDQAPADNLPLRLSKRTPNMLQVAAERVAAIASGALANMLEDAVLAVTTDWISKSREPVAGKLEETSILKEGPPESGRDTAPASAAPDKAAGPLPLWVAADGEGGEERAFAWKTLRGIW